MPERYTTQQNIHNKRRLGDKGKSVSCDTHRDWSAECDVSTFRNHRTSNIFLPQVTPQALNCLYQQFFSHFRKSQIYTDVLTAYKRPKTISPHL